MTYWLSLLREDMYSENVPFQPEKGHIFCHTLSAIWSILEHLYSEMAAEPPCNYRGPMPMLSLLQILLRMTVVFLRLNTFISTFFKFSSPPYKQPLPDNTHQEKNANYDCTVRVIQKHSQVCGQLKDQNIRIMCGNFACVAAAAVRKVSNSGMGQSSSLYKALCPSSNPPSTHFAIS